MMGVQFANHTKRLRIGTGVSLETLYHPLRLAVEVSLFDRSDCSKYALYREQMKPQGHS